MNRRLARFSCLGCLFFFCCLLAADEKTTDTPTTDKTDAPTFDYDVAHAHELKPHRRSVPHTGVQEGFHQLRLTLTVSPMGDVVKARAGGDKDDIKFWPEVEEEVLQWRFTPFEVNGKPVTAEVQEYLDLVPPERLPTKHVAAPEIRPDSKVEIRLGRGGCFGRCPSYSVSVSTDGIEFNGQYFVVAIGKYTDTVDANAVRVLAKKFTAADFYSMENKYVASVTDMPGYVLSISIDGHEKQVVDYVGEWLGMPAVVTELEEDVDNLARSKRWIDGAEGLVSALQREKFNFQSYDAQVILKGAAEKGEAATVREMLTAGVPLTPIPAPKPAKLSIIVPFEHVGWLNAAGAHTDVLRMLIRAGASKEDQNDKDLGLVAAARAGNVEGARALIAYGANPNVNLRKLLVNWKGGGFSVEGRGSGSVLIYASESGNPEMVREILRYHPNLEARDQEGQTAIFTAGSSKDDDVAGARVECVKLLAEAGANVNARDEDGNTPLHEIYETDVEEELIRLGADVNARNKDGETPIMTTVDTDAYPLLIEHGADLTVRNKAGMTVVQAVEERFGAYTAGELRKAIAAAKR